MVIFDFMHLKERPEILVCDFIQKAEQASLYMGLEYFWFGLYDLAKSK